MRGVDHLSRAAGLALAAAALLAIAYGAPAGAATRSRIPQKAQPELLTDVEHILIAYHIGPALDVKAVVTTEDRVQKLEGKPVGFSHRLVYLVVAKGPFEGVCKGSPAAECEHPGSYSTLELVVPIVEPTPSSPKVLTTEDAHFAHIYPKLAEFGVATLLSESEKR